MEAYTYCKEHLPTEYVNKWFGAKGFFNTKYTSGILKGNYFITCDHFLGGKQWALRYVNKLEGRIDTIEGSPFSSKEECLTKLKELTEG